MVAQVLSELRRIDVLVNTAFAPCRFDLEQRKRYWETDWADYQTSSTGLCAPPTRSARPGGSV